VTAARDADRDDAPAAGHRARGLRSALLVLLAALAAAFGWSELAAARDRAAAVGTDTVDVDVEPARRALAERLLDLEKRCAAFAEEALSRCGEITDRAALFTALEEVELPAAAGVQVEDRDGRVLAWAGTSVDEAALRGTPFPGDGAVLVETPASRRLAVRRTRTTPRDDVVARAVCHLPFDVRYPLRNRFFASWSLVEEVRAEHRVDTVAILPPAADRGEPLASSFGGSFARITVRPLSATAWDEAVQADLARRRSWFLVAGLVVAAAWTWIASRPLAARRPAVAALARAGLVAVARVVLGLVPAASLAPGFEITDPKRYAHGLPLALAASPADLLLTCGAALWVVACLRRAAQAARVRASTPWAGLAAVLATAIAARLALGALADDVVVNSTVEFFSDTTVLPQTASAALFAALVAAGAAAVLAIASAWTWLGPRDEPPRARLAVLAVVAAAAAFAPGPAGTASDGALAVAGIAGLAASLGVLLVDAGTALRAGIVPVGVAVAAFAPLEGHLAESLRRAVLGEAEQRISETDQTARFLVSATLDRLEQSPELARALRERRMPRDLQLRLWAESPLAQRPRGSSIEIEPRDPSVDRVRFAVNLPPVTWLPGPETWPPLGEVSAAPLAGRGPGRDGRWLVGSRRIVVDGVHAANAWVTFEVQAPSNPGLPELEILGPAAERDLLRPPPLAVSRYDVDGTLAVGETNDAYRVAGDRLDASVRERAAGDGEPVWIRAEVAGRDLAAVVLARRADEVPESFWAFSFETGGLGRLTLRGARALLCGALLGALSLLLTVRRWARGARLRLAHRIVLTYVVVSGLPLLLLGWANRELVRQSADEASLREQREAVALIAAEIEMPGTDLPLRVLELPEAARAEQLRAIAYRTGHHANVFHGEDLLASSDQGLFDTDLLPRRLPGPVFREVLLLKRPFHPFPAHAGGETFDVGYAPVQTAAGQIVGAVSVPLLHQRRLREADLADGITAILALYVVSLAAAVAVGTWLASRLTRPLRDLTTATQRVAAGDLSRPVPGAGPGELGDVVGAFNRMMRDLAESREKLVRAEKEAAWRDMARQVAHEVKNPLTPMRLAAEHLRRAWRDRVPNFDEMLERSVDLIVRQTESLKRIATSFSDFARLPGRRRDPTDVAEIARRVLHLYENTPNLAVHAEIADGLPAVLADPDELHRVLVNLAKNAAEAVEGRGGRLSLRLRRDGDHLVLEVEDDGPGIPDDVLPRLFEPYFSTKTSGTGLGLAICKRAVEDLGGTIAVRSAAGAGTTVTLRIPVTTRPGAETIAP
jgi:signal transduction histidine kinase